jgi:hypothetical protein
LITSAIRSRTLAAVVAASASWLVGTAHADLVPTGATLTAAAPNGSLNDVAFDDKHQVYLQVFGSNQVYGRFVGVNGNVIGEPFRISTNSTVFAGWPRVAYSRYSDDDVFMVVFSTDVHVPDRSKNVYGQRVRFNGSGVEFLGGNFPITDASANSAWAQEAGGLAYNNATRQFLVTWGDARGETDVFCRLFRTDGVPGGPEVNLSDARSWQGAPNAAYDWVRNRFLVTWQGDPLFNGVPVIGSWARLLDGSTGAPITGLITVSTGGFQAEENVTYLPESGQYLVAWMDIRPGNETDVMGRLISPDGVPSSGIYPLVATPGLFDGSPDLDYNAGLRTVLVAAKHDLRYVRGSELDGVGQVRRSFQASTAAPTPTGGAFSPRVIAGPDTQFGLAYMMNYQTSWVERLIAPAVTPPGPRPGGPPPQPPPPLTIDLSPATAPNGSWFMAEGVESGTATGFHTFYLVANENDVSVALRVYFAGDDGRLIEKAYVLPPRSRFTLPLSDAVGTGAFATVFQSRTAGADVFVSRSVYWGSNLEGSTGAEASRLATKWYFAEGSRGGELFHNFFLVFNPLQQATTVTFRFARADGQNVTKSYTVAAQRRLTLSANDIPELAGADFSTTIEAPTGIVAERAMYWRLLFSADPTWIGGTATLGATSPAPTWVFAEGAQGPGFDTFYLLQNPNPFPIVVNGAFATDSGGYTQRAFTVAANSRFTVYLNAVVGQAGGVTANFGSNQGNFIAERSIYWGAGRVEGTNTVGATAFAREWHFPEGVTSGQFETFLLLGNFTGIPSTVWVTLYVEGIGRFTVSQLPVAVPFVGRVTVHMNTFLSQVESVEGLAPGTLRNRPFSYKVNVIEGGPIVAEQAVYWQRDGSNFWRGGSATLGIPR